MIAKLLLADGKCFEGTSVGAQGTSYGEICFNTSMNGYQEILTDPSYAENIIVFTYPEIGNYGINDYDFENEKVFVKGLIMKNYCFDDNHYQSKKTLATFLEENNVIGINCIDTRELTTIIREEGSMPCLITTEEITEDMKKKLKEWQPDKDIVKSVSKNKKYHIEGNGLNIAVIDLGLKNSILKNLELLNCDITVYPYNVKSDEILNNNHDGVFFSNGVGNPENLEATINTVKDLKGKIPMFGICSGFQVLALALGAKVQKMKYGHRGGNHPVINSETNKVYLTSQCHSYVVDESSLPENITVTYKNLNDSTIEGFRCDELKISGVQFHPQAVLDETDALVFFKTELKVIEGYKLCQKM